MLSETHPELQETAKHAIFVTGARRTGTTVLGQLIHTLEGVEHANEPPLLSYLFPMISHMPEDSWRQLYEAYLYEEVLLPALAGRGINLNPHDASSVRKVKSPAELEERLGQSWRRPDLVGKAKSARVSFKMPQLLPQLRAFQALYPNTQVVLTVRRPHDTVASVLAKGWYSDTSPHSATAERNVRWVGGRKLPAWVEDDMVDAWWDMSATERALYDYVQQYEQVPEGLDGVVVEYDAFAAAPHDHLSRIAAELGLAFGAKTERRLEEVFQIPRDNRRLLDDAADELVERAWRAYESVAVMAEVAQPVRRMVGAG